MMLRLYRLAEIAKITKSVAINSHIKKQAGPAFTRFISTSKKNSDTATSAVIEKTNDKTEPAVEDKDIPDYLNPKTHVSYGFSTDPKEDVFFMHITFFLTVSMCLVFGGTFWAYVPDPALIHWASREGHLQLRYREENGLPLVDPNYVDPATIHLPSDEELGDTEIII